MAKELLRPSQFSSVDPLRTQAAATDISEEQQQELASLYEENVKEFKVGKIVTGTVLEHTSDGVIIDVQYKSNGVIPLYEFKKYELEELHPGSTIDVIVDTLENYDGNVVLSYEKAKSAKAWDAIIKLHEEDKPVKGIVTSKVKGGLSVDIGVTAFLPGSQVDVQRITDFDQFVGKTINAKILKVNPRRGNIIISRRQYLNEQLSESRKQILESLDVGQVIDGTVKNITKYGVFIDIGGVDGLLHITDMTWGRISHPSEIVNLGDTVSVKVLSFDKVNQKISLGMKQLKENPWEDLPEKIEIGSVVTGTISSIPKEGYGLFVEIAPGIEGLVHISEISWTDRIENLQTHYSVGQHIKAIVDSIDKESQRISLSIRKMQENPWERAKEEFKVGQEVEGTISNITDFGMFVQLIPGVDGLIRTSNLSWTEKYDNPKEAGYEVGKVVKALITDVNVEKKKISLSIKHLEKNPWDGIEKEMPVGSMVEGRVERITDAGAQVSLKDDIEAFVPVSAFGTAENMKQTLSEDATHNFKVAKINKDEHKVILGVKGEAKRKQKEQPAKKTKQQQPRQEPTKLKSSLQLELEKHAARGEEE